MSTLGYVPGVLLYFIFGVTAMYTGLTLYRLFLDLDKPERYFIYFYHASDGFWMSESFFYFSKHSMPLQKPKGPRL